MQVNKMSNDETAKKEHHWKLYVYPGPTKNLIAATYTCDPDDNSPLDYFCPICDKVKDISQDEIEKILDYVYTHFGEKTGEQNE